MNCVKSLLGTLLLAACSGATPGARAPLHAPAASQRAPSPTKTPQLVEDAAPRTNQPAFERTAPRASAACVLEGDPWLPEQDGGALTLTPGGAEFLKVDASQAQIEIPIGKARDVFVRITAVGWRVAGHLAAHHFSVHPTDIRAREILIPTELANLTLNEAQEGQLLLDLPAQLPVRLAAPLAPLAYSCDEVSVGIVPPFELESALPGTPTSRKDIYFTRGEIPISVEPGSPTLAWLADEGRRREALLLERRGRFAQIALLSHITAVVGWVPSSAVRFVLPRPDNELYGEGGLGLAGGSSASAPATMTPDSDLTHYRCDRELALLASAGAETLAVGSIAPGTRFTAHTPSAGLARLVTPKFFELTSNASFQAYEAELADCTTLP